MAPKDSVERSESDSNESTLDWDWISGLDPDRLEEDDLARIVSTVSGWQPDPEVEPDKVIRMFQLSAAALRSRDADLVRDQRPQNRSTKKNFFAILACH